MTKTEVAVPGFDLPDGTFIHERFFNVPDSTTLVVFIHGDGQHLSNYLHVKDRLMTECGFCVYLYDARFHGRSGGGSRNLEDDFPNGFPTYVEDLCHILQNRINLHGQFNDVFLMAHSIGTAVALSADITLRLSNVCPNFRGSVLLGVPIAIQLSRDQPTGAPFPMAALTSNPEWQKKLEDDPLLKVEVLSAWYVNRTLDAFELILSRLSEVTMPFMQLYGEADVLSPRGGVDALNEQAGSDNKGLKTYPGYAHELLLEEGWAQVVDDAANWINSNKSIIDEQDS